MTISKDFKLILILGIVSIIVSSIGLYQFRNVKFKNTKNLQKNQIEKQQEIVDQYNDLVDVYIPNITDKLPQNQLPTTGKITLLIPGFFENKGFYTLSDKLLQNEIQLAIEKIDSPSQYESIVKNSLQNYDIALIHTSWIDGLSLQEINLGENIKPYFINIFSELLDSKNAIPFSLDPAITLYKDTTPQNTREKLFSYSLLWKVSKRYAMPIIRGFDEMTLKLLENNSTPFENYIEILILQLKQIKNMGDNQELSNMLNTNNISTTNKYTYTNQKQIINLLSKQNEFCETYPATCIIRYGYSDIKFGFLSDFDILDTYFPASTNLYAGDFTNSIYSYPARGRVFIVPNGNENTNLTNKFFSEYISASIDGNDTFWNHTLSAITNIYQQQKENQFFKNILSNEDNFYLFTNSINLQNQIVNDGKTLNMLRGKYSTNSYIKNFTY